VERGELPSEDPAHPVEKALVPGVESGWAASEPGQQVLRIVLDAPQRLRRLRLMFRESSVERTEELTLRWHPAHGSAGREIVRQQWTFSPGGAVEETEDADTRGGTARASLHSLRMA
jgi:hypothetical protein